MPLIDHFGILAPYYDKVIRFETAERIARLARLPTQGALLDAGGGTGRVAQALRRQAGWIVVADISLGMLRQVRLKGGLQPVQAHTEGLPFADDCFDRIIMIDALHHVINQGETTRELWRVLKPGGRLVIEEPDVRNLAVKLVALAEKLALMRSHFLAPPRIAEFFPYSKAHVAMEMEGYNAWVLVDKAA